MSALGTIPIPEQTAARFAAGFLPAGHSVMAAKALFILAALFRGAHNIPPTTLRRGNWSNPHYADCVVPTGGGFATFDGDQLTRLVLLAHAACIRVSLKAVGPGYGRLYFSQRQREGDFMDRHPTIEQAAADPNLNYYLTAIEELKHEG